MRTGWNWRARWPETRFFVLALFQYTGTARPILPEMTLKLLLNIVKEGGKDRKNLITSHVV